VSSTNVPLTQDPPASASPDPALADRTDAPGAADRLDPVAPEAASAGPTGSIQPSEPDAVAAAAVDLAREAAESVAEPGTVGEHLGVTLDEGGLTMHSFRCTARGYRGWRWAVTLAHLPDSDRVTVCDTVLLPGADAVLAPDWVPWSDRLAPGDLGAGDDLPYRPDDPLLVPGYTVTDEDDTDQVLFWELGLGRERVLGPEGLRAAAQRWERGPHGPTAELAVQASAACLTCAFLLPVSGPLRAHFGVCTNEWSPADGTVVTFDFGCGAHSETDLELPAPEPLPPHILDDTIVEMVTVDREPETDTADAPAPAASIEAETGLVEPETELAEGGAVESAEPAVESPESTAEGAEPSLERAGTAVGETAAEGEPDLTSTDDAAPTDEAVPDGAPAGVAGSVPPVESSTSSDEDTVEPGAPSPE
jgi:Protein of unknown function (DUF3027)